MMVHVEADDVTYVHLAMLPTQRPLYANTRSRSLTDKDSNGNITVNTRTLRHAGNIANLVLYRGQSCFLRPSQDGNILSNKKTSKSSNGFY